MTGKWIIAAGAAALASAAPLSAAIYIKYDGVPGESKAEMTWKVEKGEKAEGFTGGVNVANGDVNGDGATQGRGDGKVDARDYTVWRNSGASAPGAPGDIAAPGANPRTVGLLLPAVQKVRAAAAARPAGMACEVGATLRNLIIRNDETAQVVRVPEAKVTACSAEQISLNFSKVEAMNPAERPMRMRARE